MTLALSLWYWPDIPFGWSCMSDLVMCRRDEGYTLQGYVLGGIHRVHVTSVSTLPRSRLTIVYHSKSSQGHRQANQHVQHAAVVLLVLVISIPGIRQEKTISNDASMPPPPGRQPGQHFFGVFVVRFQTFFFLLSSSHIQQIWKLVSVKQSWQGISVSCEEMQILPSIPNPFNACVLW